MPVALISTRTSPVFGPSRSSSTISSGFFASKATAARVFMILNPVSCSVFGAHTGIFRIGIGFGLVLMLCGTHASDRVIGARAQIDVDVVHVTGDVRIVAEGRHHILL